MREKIKCNLITGGAGFIASNLIKIMPTNGAPIIAIDNLLPQVHGLNSQAKELSEKVKLIKADVSDSSTWNEFLEKFEPETVFHFAAETGTSQSLTYATRHAVVNVCGTTEMLDAFARQNVQPKRIVLASSRAVYGEGMWRELKTGRSFYAKPRSNEALTRGAWDPVNVGAPIEPLPHDAQSVLPQPTSIYGATKLAQEHILKAWCGAFRVPLSILRLQNVYGEGQSPINPYTGIINVFHKMARSHKAIQVYEDGLITRDFVHVDDVAQALLRVSQADECEDHVLDIGSGVATTILEAAQEIARFHNAPEPEVCRKFRDGDVRCASANISGMVNILGLSPAVDIHSGFTRVGKWLIEEGYI